MPVSSEVIRTANTVRSSYVPSEEYPRPRMGKRIAFSIIAAAFAGLMLTPGHTQVQTPAASGANGELFSLTNQDRASNGIASLAANGVLDGIGGGTPYRVCGLTVDGRSQDMINRNYFAHQIPPCGAYVFTMMQEAHVNYRSAGENVGWEANAADPASYINSQFMNSSEHRSNILDCSYTALGVGSAGGNNWMGQNNVIMFSEEFAQLNGTGSCAPLPPPAPRNSVPPPPPSVTPVTTSPASNPGATPVPSPTPVVLLDLGPGGPPLIWSSSGLLSDSVESVLEGYFVN
jgi:uncharacterized protein YkwD